MQGSNGKSNPVNPDGTDHMCESTWKCVIKKTIIEAYIPTQAQDKPVLLVVHPR
jgi:hypothetical protein